MITANSIYKQLTTRVKYNNSYTTQAILSFYTSPFSFVNKLINDLLLEMVRNQYNAELLSILNSFYENEFSANFITFKCNKESIETFKKFEYADEDFLKQYLDDNVFLFRLSNTIAIPINKLHEYGCFIEIKLDDKFEFEDIKHKCILDVEKGEIKIYKLIENDLYKSLILEILVQLELSR